MGRQVRDLTGQEFGYYTAIRRLSKEEKEELDLNKNLTYWICQCSCGKEKPVDFGNLVSLRANSCGCARQRNVKPGAKFGKLTVNRLLTPRERKELGKDHKIPYWKCDCECGETSIQQTANLLSGRGWHCGCENSLVGEKFGRLRVLSKTNARKNSSIVYECRCDCGKVVRAKAHSLTLGDKKSCGCMYHERDLKLEGRKFGRLKVLREATLTERKRSKKRIPKGRSAWLCECRCGKKVVIQGNSLTKGLTRSCGCYRRDKMRGKSHPCYRHDLTKKEREERRHGSLYAAEKENDWRRKCFKREDYTCQITGKRGGILSVHHIYNFADHPKRRYDMRNGFVMTKQLHEQFHNRYGRGKNTRKQLNDFIHVIIRK